MSRPYPEYRDSGDVWLGALPSHWEVRRLKQVADAYPSNIDKKSHEGQLPVRLCNYTDVYYNDVIADAGGLMAATASEEQIEKFSLRASDVIITKDSETADDIAVSAYVPNDLPEVVCGYHLSIIRPKAGASGAFLKRYFDSHYAKASVAVRANGLTRVGLGQYAVDNLLLPIPPLEEQTAIAAFLDRETGKIDALVETQRRLIDLLKDKRQAVISHAVTKGFDRAAPMKHSGVEWIGEVPEHWQVKALKRVTETCCDGPFGSGLKSEHYVDEGVRVIRLQNIKQHGFDGRDAAFIGISYFETALSRHDVREGDVLIAGLGDERNLVGRACVAPAGIEPAMVKADCFRFRLGPEADAEFVTHQLNAGAEYASGKMSTGSTRSRIALSSMMDRLVVIPPVPEQREIVARLGSKLEAATALVNKAEAGIVLLLERRAALISAAVTGKIDVRRSIDPLVAADATTARRLVGAAVLELVADTPASGRMTSAKRMYLAEAHAGVWELQGQPQRMAAGPFDGNLMGEVEADRKSVV